MDVTSEAVVGPKELPALEEDDWGMFRYVVRGFPTKDDGLNVTTEGRIVCRGWVTGVKLGGSENVRMRLPLGVRVKSVILGRHGRLYTSR